MLLVIIIYEEKEVFLRSVVLGETNEARPEGDWLFHRVGSPERDYVSLP